MMGIFFVGNFLGEELYFRGYLMKKTAFLGGWNWVFNSVAFSLYHLWQAPQTICTVSFPGASGKV